jgi:hypothetical protein
MRPSEKYAVRRGSMEDGRRMHSACFAHASQRWPRRSSSLPCPASDNGGYVNQTGGYCWPTSFKVLRVLFLGAVSSAFLPSKKACWAHQFRYVGVGQQYPGGLCALEQQHGSDRGMQERMLEAVKGKTWSRPPIVMTPPQEAPCASRESISSVVRVRPKVPWKASRVASCISGENVAHASSTRIT